MYKKLSLLFCTLRFACFLDCAEYYNGSRRPFSYYRRTRVTSYNRPNPPNNYSWQREQREGEFYDRGNAANRYRLEKLRIANLSFHPKYFQTYESTTTISIGRPKEGPPAKKTFSGIIGEFLSNVVKNFKKLVGNKTEEVVHRGSSNETFNRKVFIGKKFFWRVSRKLPNNTRNSNLSDPTIIMKLDSPTLYRVYKPQFVNFAETFLARGHEIRFSGGTVRDILRGRIPYVLNFATTAQPEEIRRMFEAETNFHFLDNKLRNPSTIALRCDGMKFRVSPLMNEMVSAEKASFEADWETDAASRDFTVNALYIGLDGSVYDYFNGYQDLQEKKIIFVGIPNKRIQYDYVRIIKYFRMIGTVADNPNVHDVDAIQAIKKNAFGLQQVPGRTLWREFQQIFFGNFVYEIITTMLNLGLSIYLGLGSPSELDLNSFKYFCSLPDQFKYKPLSYIGSLLYTDSQLLRFVLRMNLAPPERELLKFVITHKNVTSQDETL